MNLKTKKFFQNKDHTIKKVIVFQNIKDFLIPSLKYDPVNPTHKIIVWGLKKKSKRNCRKPNYERIALLVKIEIINIILAIYFVIGWFLLCR